MSNETRLRVIVGQFYRRGSRNQLLSCKLSQIIRELIVGSVIINSYIERNVSLNAKKKRLTNSCFLIFRKKFPRKKIHSLCVLLLLICSTESGSNSFEFYLKPIHRISLTFFANAIRRTTWYVFEKFEGSTYPFRPVILPTHSRICFVPDDHVRLRSHSSLTVKSIPPES